MQQVNLYTDEFKPKKVVLPLEQMIVLPVMVILLFVALSFWLDHRLSVQESDISAMQVKNDEMSSRLDVLTERANKQRKDESLVSANQRLHAKLVARQQMIDMLDTVVVKDDEGFSGILLSLARQKLDKLWLNSIFIGASGKEMHIEGRTLNGDLVPQYLQNLRQEASFLGRTFTMFELNKNTANNKLLDFSLRSEEQLMQPDVLLSKLDSSEEIVNFSKGLNPKVDGGARP